MVLMKLMDLLFIDLISRLSFPLQKKTDIATRKIISAWVTDRLV